MQWTEGLDDWYELNDAAKHHAALRAATKWLSLIRSRSKPASGSEAAGAEEGVEAQPSDSDSSHNGQALAAAGSAAAASEAAASAAAAASGGRMPTLYYVAAEAEGDESHAEAALSELGGLIASGAITGGTQIWVEGLSEWMSLASAIQQPHLPRALAAAAQSLAIPPAPAEPGST
eukprot:SAG11_NODE_3452_length_2440_cov_2.349423_1_plen_176_part_00